MPDTGGREWLIEEGIGEHRAILFVEGQAEAARLEWPGCLSAGMIDDAVLVSRQSGSPRGTARFASGEQALIDGLPRDASEGSALRIEITRAAMAETGRFKHARGRPAETPSRSSPSLAQRLAQDGEPVRIVRRLPSGVWEDIVSAARDGVFEFAGGGLIVSPTPAMTLIDIDGVLSPKALALAAAPAIAQTIRLFDLAGSIGIDFPSLASKEDRRKVDGALAGALSGWQHQSTAMNGFGFIQLVSRLERPSLVHRLRQDPAGAAARMLLRQAEHVEAPGILLLTAHPVVRSAMQPGWEAELSRRTGRRIAWDENAGLALAGGFAQAVSP